MPITMTNRVQFVLQGQPKDDGSWKKIKISFNGLNIWGFMLSDACGVRKCMLREHSFASPGTQHWTWKSKYCV